MFTAARSLCVAVARSGSYVVHSTSMPVVESLTHLFTGHSVVLDCEDHEHQTQWCVASLHEYSFGLS